MVDLFANTLSNMVPQRNISLYISVLQNVINAEIPGLGIKYCCIFKHLDVLLLSLILIFNMLSVMLYFSAYAVFFNTCFGNAME